MQTSRSAFIVAGLMAGFLCASPVWAEPPDDYDDERSGEGMPHPSGHSGMAGSMSVDRLKQRLSLTDDQLAKLKELRRNYLKETLMLETRIKIAELELADLLDAKKLEVPAIEKKVREQEGLRSDLTMQRVRSLLKAGEFLTPEQLELFRAMTVRRMEMGGAHPSTMRKDKDGDHPASSSPHGMGMSPGMGSGMKPSGHPPATPGMASPHR